MLAWRWTLVYSNHTQYPLAGCDQLFFFVILICNILVLASIHIYPHPANTLFLAGVFGWSDQLTCRLSRGYCIKDDCKVVHNSEGLWLSGMPHFSIKRHPYVFYTQEVASSILGSTIISKVWTRWPISAPCKYTYLANSSDKLTYVISN